MGARCAVAAAILALSSAAASGAEPPGRLPFAVMGPDQGVPPPLAVSLAQDRDGFVWLATETGLVRYEGGQHRRFTEADGLPSNYASQVVAATGGGVWATTQRGLALLRDGRVELASAPGQATALHAGRLALDRRGRLWVASGLGLYVQAADARFQPVPWPPDRTYGLWAGGPTGNVYVATPAGVQVIRPEGAMLAWTAADGLPAAVTLVIEDGASRVWAGGGRQLAVKEPGSARFVDRSALLPASLSPNGTPILDRDGSVWLPTQDGALHLWGDRAEVLDQAHGLPFHGVRTLLRDREGTLWVLGAELARMLGAGRLSNYPSPSSTGEVVWFVHRTRKGTLLVGTDDGVSRLDGAGFSRIPGTEGLRIKGLAEEASGLLWMVGTMGPALWLRPGQARAEPAPLGTSVSDANSVLVDSKGRVWLAHPSKGVLRWDPASRALVAEAGPAEGGAPLAAIGLAEDALGRIWSGASSGLLVREPDGRWHRFGPAAGLKPFGLNGLGLLPDGTAWIHYQESRGIARVRVHDGKLEVLEERLEGPGLRSSNVYAVRTDPRGRTWVTTDRGLDQLDTPVHFGREAGAASEDCSIHALLAEDGQVWVGTSGGLFRVATSGVEAPLSPPVAHILRVQRGEALLEPPFGALAPIPAREATLEFRVGAPSYLSEREVRFQVRLAGLEDGWRTSESRLVRYPALPGGRYRFEVRAAIGERPFGPAAGLDFEVRPPWWRTWWARSLATLAAAAAVLAFIRLRLAQLARTKAALEVVVAARTAELRTRNEELSAALGKVKTLSGLIPICSNCKKIRDDKGYWNQLETYITKHSEAGFSHGICPDCVDHLYPEFSDKIPRPGKAPKPGA